MWREPPKTRSGRERIGLGRVVNSGLPFVVGPLKSTPAQLPPRKPLKPRNERARMRSAIKLHRGPRAREIESEISRVSFHPQLLHLPFRYPSLHLHLLFDLHFLAGLVCLCSLCLSWFTFYWSLVLILFAITWLVFCMYLWCNLKYICIYCEWYAFTTVFENSCFIYYSLFLKCGRLFVESLFQFEALKFPIF